MSSLQHEERDASLTYVCMPGSPYTGSTLLGFLLNSHPECVSIGAATGLTSRIDLSTYDCSCGRPFRACEFWQSVAQRTIELGSPVDVFSTDFWETHVRLSRHRALNGVLVRSLGNDRLTDLRDAIADPFLRRAGTLRRAQNTTWSLARAVLDVSGKSVFVDTARDHQRPKYLAPEPRLDLKVLHLVRDPRGNVSSIMKHTGVSVTTASRQWRHYNAEADRVRRYVGEERWMTVRYNELCANPQQTLENIERFVGVPPAPVCADLQAGENHIIGNSMRLRAIGEIREDNSWRESLSGDDLKVIERATGDLSRRLGLDWP